MCLSMCENFRCDQLGNDGALAVLADRKSDYNKKTTTTTTRKRRTFVRPVSDLTSVIINIITPKFVEIILTQTSPKLNY